MAMQSSIGKYVLLGIIGFVVIAGGVFTGIFVSVKTGLASDVFGDASIPQEFHNNTVIKTGDAVPEIIGTTPDGSTTTLAEYLDGQPGVVAYVSNGCDPCHKMAEHFQNSEALKNGEFRLVLISLDPQFFVDEYGYDALQIDASTTEELQLFATPTMFGIRPDGTVGFVVSGFSPDLGDEYFLKYLGVS
jgi:thiol-disulfide isomerase/thioredoxin